MVAPSTRSTPHTACPQHIPNTRTSSKHHRADQPSTTISRRATSYALSRTRTQRCAFITKLFLRMSNKDRSFITIVLFEHLRTLRPATTTSRRTTTRIVSFIMNTVRRAFILKNLTSSCIQNTNQAEQLFVTTVLSHIRSNRSWSA